jgi:hypothetical protein
VIELAVSLRVFGPPSRAPISPVPRVVLLAFLVVVGHALATPSMAASTTLSSSPVVTSERLVLFAPFALCALQLHANTVSARASCQQLVSLEADLDTREVIAHKESDVEVAHCAVLELESDELVICTLPHSDDGPRQVIRARGVTV